MRPVAEIFGGVETGGTWCVCALGTGPEDLIALERFPTASPDETLSRLEAFFRSGPAVAALGIGSFGPVDLDPDSSTWGSVTSTPKPGWQDVAVAPVLAERLRVPVAFDTDVNAAALAEQRWGAGRGLDTLCYVTVGTGVGAGVIVAGRTLRGLIHPEAGHMRIPHDHRRDPFRGCCPWHGDCWEGLASGGAMAERWGVPPEQLPVDHPGWELEADYVAAGILNMIAVASPHRVILGGGVADHPGLLAMVAERVRGLAGGYLRTPLLEDRVKEYVVAPQLGDRAGVLGALALAQAIV